MGSTTPPETPHDPGGRLTKVQSLQQPSKPHDSDVGIGLSNQELIELLKQRDLEICHLKVELEKYKIALKSLKINRLIVGTNDDEQEEEDRQLLESLIDANQILTDKSKICDVDTLISGSTSKNDTSLSIDLSSQVRHLTKPNPAAPGREGDDSETSDAPTLGGETSERKSMRSLLGEISQATTRQNESEDDLDSELQDIIDDVCEIPINLDLIQRERSKQRKKSDNNDQAEINCDKDDVGKEQYDDNEDGDIGLLSNADVTVNASAATDNDDSGVQHGEDNEENILTEGLLTSLTDAAISNLSQLAALQERCEYQQQQDQHHHQMTAKSIAHRHFDLSEKSGDVLSAQVLFESNQSRANLITPDHHPEGATSVSDETVSSSSQILGGNHHDHHSSARFSLHDPFSALTLAGQAALALKTSSSNTQTSILPPVHTVSSTSSATMPLGVTSSAIQDLNLNQSLASVVAAAAAAAAEAAAVNEHQRHSQTTKHHLHRVPPTQQQLHSQQQQQQSRLITTSMAPSDFYQNLHHHQQHQQQPTSLAHQISPISSINFTPSITTPSPSSLIGGPSHHTRRSVSNASPSLLSPIASPNYLRRQFMHGDRGLPIMSHSPTTSLGTVGSSSGIGSVSSSAHILQATHHHPQGAHHQQQQRSASALAGPISSPASTSNAPLSSSAVSPLLSSKNSSQARLNNMQIRHKFGYLGSARGQFNSPHGFCLGLNQEIVVADTNNHRVCIFDKDGTYITQFGSPGKEEGQLWNPRKVAILHRPLNGNGTTSGRENSSGGTPMSRGGATSSASTFSSNFTSGGGIQSAGGVNSGNHFASEPLYVVCDRGAERSRMQLFTKDGVFIKKIGIHYIDIVAGLAITQNGLIIVVDSVSPTVYIINAETGTLNGWFDCSGHMKEPSDIAVKSDIPGNEYFICDFKGHCVVVFSEQGDYLRKIGHDGLTSYPNGIDISDDGDILVGDSHGNRFHVVVFDRNGNFVSQFECPHVKVSRCCGLKITREGYIVTLAKNNHHVLVLDTIHI